jgi:hypothetical protein
MFKINRILTKLAYDILKMLGKLNRYLARVSIFLITAALIAGMVGCGCNPPPSKDLEIRTWYDLDAVRNNLAGNHKLMNDLDASTLGYEELAGPTANEGKGWQPIGLYTPHGPTCCIGLGGTFSGQGYEIRDLFINRPDEDDVGLFKYVEGYYGIVEDIGVTNVIVIGRNGVGGLVGSNFGTLSNCYCSGEVTGNASIGGLAGGGNGIVTDSYFTGSVTGYDYVGGLVGDNFCDVSNSHFAGNVTGHSHVGGLLGANGGATVSDCYCSGAVTGHEHVGGLVGFAFEGAVIDSYSTASVTGETGVGGLLGDSHWTQQSWSGDPWSVFPWSGVTALGIVKNSYYDYDNSLINDKNVITIAALSGEDFEQWLANDKFLDINGRLYQENGYYLIENVGDFKQLLAFGQNASLKFRLTSDLNLATEPGLYIPYLAGEFDGNGHRISNLSFNCGSVCYVGLFGYLAPGAAVTQVGADNVNISGARSVGALVGQSMGSVNGSYSTGSVTGSGDIGGLVGANGGTVTNSHSTASVSGGDAVGGLAGSDYDGSVDGSYSTGRVTGRNYVGGLVGLVVIGNVSNSYFTGSVTGEHGVGGLAGFGLGTNSYYDNDKVLINGENIVTVGALSGEDLEQWLANDRSLDVNGRLAQQGGYYLINDVDDLKQLLAFGQNASLKFRLTKDLDLAAEPNFYIPYLAGEFDGDGHKILNLSFEFEFASYVGLFGYLAPGGSVAQVGSENVNVAGNYYVGGLVGFSAGNVSRSYSTGSVTGNRSVGGLAGYNLGTVSSSHSTIRVTGDQRVGGLVGWNDYGLDTDGIVSDSYSTGSVTGNWAVGGLVGVNYYAVNNSYSTASVAGHDYVGGLAGLGGATVSNSFWDRQISGRSFSHGGTRKSTREMKNITTFSGAGWNITAVASAGTRNPSYIWNIVDGVTYPFPSWQPV